MTSLRTIPGFNPFVVDMGKTTYVIEKFVFFNNDGVVFTHNSGWFGSNNKLKGMVIPVELKRKRKVVFDKDFAYLISSGKKFGYFDYYAVLYIHIDIMDFQVSTIQESDGAITRTHNKYVSKTYDIEAIDWEHYDETIDYEKKGDIEHLEWKLESLLKEAEEIKDELYNKYGIIK